MAHENWKLEPWSKEQFKQYTPEIVRFCISKVAPHILRYTPVVIKAPVKSGKRLIAEYLSLLVPRNPFIPVGTTKHMYITSLSRKDTAIQRQLLHEGYNFSVFTISSPRQVDFAINKVDVFSRVFDRIVIHHDELDYGSDQTQLFSQFFSFAKKITTTTFVWYSATPEEIEYTKEVISGKTQFCVFVPPENKYCGAKWFLDNNLVVEAMEFCDFDEMRLTIQGQEAINRLLHSDKTFGMLRISYDNNYDRANLLLSHILKDFTKTPILVRPVNAENSFDWSNTILPNNPLPEWARYVRDKKKVILLINQTCSRSTEIVFHKHISFLHEFRSRFSNYNTIAQSQLRTIHYKDQNNNACYIKIYGCLGSWLKQADYISSTALFLNRGRNPSQRLKMGRQTLSNNSCY